VTVLGAIYGAALTAYFVGLVVVGVRMRRRAGVRGFWTLVPDVIGWRSALEAMGLLALWPFTTRKRQAWVVRQAIREDDG
jgi:hypothetical protein